MATMTCGINSAVSGRYDLILMGGDNGVAIATLGIARFCDKRERGLKSILIPNQSRRSLFNNTQKYM